MSSSFVLRTPDEGDIGVIAFADRDGERPPAGTTIACSCRAFTMRCLSRTSRATFVAAHKGKEWHADVSYTANAMAVRIALDDGWRFELHSSETGNRWMAEREGVRMEGTGTVPVGIARDR